MAGAYPADEYLEDLIRVTSGQTNEDLARLTIEASEDLPDWLQKRGVHFQPPLSGTLHLARTNAFFLGGGKALVNALFDTAETLGVDIEYQCTNIQLQCDRGVFTCLEYTDGDNHLISVSGDCLVAAAGGFEANRSWLREAWGEAANQFVIRGTPHNQGEILRQLLAAGAASVGDPKQCHAIAVDGRAPECDGGIATRVDSVPLGIVVNKLGERFYDEGEDFWPKRYAIWGRLIADQPGQTAWVLTDAKADGLFMPTVYPPVRGASIAEIAARLELPEDTLVETVTQFNQAVIPGELDLAELDHCRTRGLTINKSHWARTIDEPPFSAWPLRPGITFTYLGVRVDERARVLMQDGTPSHNLFAAGELMAGNILGQGYLAGIGMTIGSVFGRIAGSESAS